MHSNCANIFQGFAPFLPKGIDVLDVGSYDVNGNLRAFFKEQNYTGTDIEAGPNVDVVCQMYNFGSKQYDCVVSANCMEHVKALWKWALAIDDVVKPGGTIAITAPNTIHYHPHPVHCWNIRKDGMRYCFTEMMEEFGRKPYNIIQCDELGMDTFIHATKPQ